VSFHTFTYNTDIESANLMLDDLIRALNDCGVEKGEAQPILLGVSEAFTNALEHGNRWNPSKKVVLELNVNETSITADIIDEGNGGLERIKAREPADLMSEGGRGINLMHHNVASIDFVEEKHGGIRASLRFARELKAKIRKS